MVRITLTDEEYDKLITGPAIRTKEAKKLLCDNAKHGYEDKRTKVLQEVGKKKAEAMKQQIRDAVAHLRSEGSTISIYSVAKLCGSNWSTVKKYEEILKEGEQLSMLESEGE